MKLGDLESNIRLICTELRRANVDKATLQINVEGVIVTIPIEQVKK